MIDNLEISRIGYSTIRITGTSESGIVSYLIQDSPGSTPSQYATPTGTESVTPGEPFSFDVAGLTPGEKRVWVGDATEAPSAWMQTVVPDTSLADAVLWTDPSRQSITSETERVVYGRRGSVASATRLTSSGIDRIWEGDAKTAWYAPVVADALSGISGKSSISGRDYYNLSNSAWYVEWSYGEDFECDSLGMYFIISGTSNGVAEILRDRGGTVSTIGEIDTNAGSTGPGTIDVGSFRFGHTILTGGIAAGDKIRIKRKDGDSNNVRILSVIAFSSVSLIDGKPFWGTNWTQFTGNGSSMEWAYNVTLNGSTTLVGNVAHQTPWPESSRIVEYLVNGVDVTTTGGAALGGIEVHRSANIDMNSSVAAASYDMTTSWTASGIRCEHEVTFNESVQVNTAYIGMFSGAASHSEANGNGVEADISLDNGSTVQLGSGTQMQIATTPQGRMTTLVLGYEVKCFVVQSATATGNKLYGESLSGEKAYAPGESIIGSWDLVLGMPR